jgi:hypothetical protein
LKTRSFTKKNLVQERRKICQDKSKAYRDKIITVFFLRVMAKNSYSGRLIQRLFAKTGFIEKNIVLAKKNFLGGKIISSPGTRCYSRGFRNKNLTLKFV